MNLDPTAQMVVSGVVVGIVQLIKFSKILPDRAAIYVSAVASIIGMIILLYAYPITDRTAVVSVFALFYNIWSSASGVYGIANGKSETLTATIRSSDAPKE